MGDECSPATLHMRRPRYVRKACFLPPPALEGVVSCVGADWTCAAPASPGPVLALAVRRVTAQGSCTGAASDENVLVVSWHEVLRVWPGSVAVAGDRGVCGAPREAGAEFGRNHTALCCERHADEGACEEGLRTVCG